MDCHAVNQQFTAGLISGKNHGRVKVIHSGRDAAARRSGSIRSVGTGTSDMKIAVGVKRNFGILVERYLHSGSDSGITGTLCKNIRIPILAVEIII